MKYKELKAARRLITKVLANPSIGPDQRDELQRVKREISKITSSGKLDRDRIFRITEMISSVLLDVIESLDVMR